MNVGITLAADHVKLRRDLAVEFQQLLLDSDSATRLLANWLDTTITVSVTSHNEDYEPTYQQRRQLLYYQPTGECWKRVAWLTTADGTRISHATTVIVPERLDPQQQTAIREGVIPLGRIWSGAAVRRHALDERLLRESVLYNLDDPWLEISARLTVRGLPAAAITEQYFEDFLYVHPRWVAKYGPDSELTFRGENLSVAAKDASPLEDDPSPAPMRRRQPWDVAFADSPALHELRARMQDPKAVDCG